ncbi:hypothetical protein XCR1_1370011 [Xenorhabdus cabanillasii JM26]|uniref:Uncharacterized protein n=1 Tax=Xenorhabdus cabanillasii JM26 TaxID=1427517 RepID=W1IR49_9GAMM|nr:hypothetical protein XCR1_1370011 [Xenorhabdus cabanillasii JM26]
MIETAEKVKEQFLNLVTEVIIRFWFFTYVLISCYSHLIKIHENGSGDLSKNIVVIIFT